LFRAKARDVCRLGKGSARRLRLHAESLAFLPEFVALARAAGVAIVYADSADYPPIADVGGDFVYARLEAAVEDEPAGHAPAALDRWADPAPVTPRATFVFFINGAKVRAPLGAMALIERVALKARPSQQPE